MKKLNKAKILMLIVLIIVIIIEIKAFRDSIANNIIDVTAKISDISGLLTDEEITLQALTDAQGNYYIVLPEYINDKKVSKYEVEEKYIDNTQTDTSEEITENTVTENTTVVNDVTTTDTNEITNDVTTAETNEITDNITPDTSNSDTNEITDTTTSETEETNTTTDETTSSPRTVEATGEKIEALPGDTLYLTDTEKQDKQINLQIEYDVNATETTNLYYKQISSQIDTRIFTVEGYMPVNSTLEVQAVEDEDKSQIAIRYGNSTAQLIGMYDIKIMSEGTEYEPSTDSQTATVTVTGLDTIDIYAKRYKVVHLTSANSADQILNVDTKQNSVIFSTSSFSIYAIVLEDRAQDEGVARADLEPIDIGATLSTSADVWDGTIASGFFKGDGSQANPYLITTGAELAYLASTVNNGTTYEGQYVQLTNDINLNNREWTPIGNTANRTEQSFKGIFDGAGRVIGNATINITENRPDDNHNIRSYGFFGSLGNSSTYAIIKNVTFDNIDMLFNVSGTSGDSTSIRRGYDLGIVVGTMYNHSEVTNVKVTNSSIVSTQNHYIRSRSYQVFVGGIAGCAQNAPGNYDDPGEGARYRITNCYVSADINTNTIQKNTGIFANYSYYLAFNQTGGIIGNVQRQPVWPEYCLFSGSITARGIIGPIFGGVVSFSEVDSPLNNAQGNNYNNFRPFWNGHQLYGDNPTTLNMTSYYTNYTANGNTYTDTVINGYIGSAPSNNNMTSVQRVNKGIYVNDISTIINDLNNNNPTVVWEYVNGDISLKERLTTSVTQTYRDHYDAIVNDKYNVGTYKYEWYNNGSLETSFASNYYEKQPSLTEDQEILLLVNDGTYNSIIKFLIEKLYIAIEFNINTSNNTVTAQLVGTALPYVDLNAYTYQWYKQDISGMEVEVIDGATTLILTNLEDFQDYKLIATYPPNSGLNAENVFCYGDRIVVYVDYNYGNDSNDGFTEATAVRTLRTGYTKLSSSGNVKSNVIVLMGNYTDTDFIYGASSSTQSGFGKNATITGCYYTKNYSAWLQMEGSPDTSNYRGRYLYADTALQYMTLSSSSGRTYLYCQGYSLTMGEQIYLENYTTTSNTNAMLDNGPAPDFHILGGYADLNTTTLLGNNGTITIKSGAFARVIGGSRNTQVNSTSRNTTGTASNPANMKIVIDVKNPTRQSAYTYDVNLLVAGQTDGNIYANAQLEVKNGTIGRVTGGSIGYDRTVSNFSSNSFYGSSKITISGGQIQELFGGSLGRNQADVYFYGNIEINIEGGTINNNVYGVGAGGVTGYSERSTDNYKSYGQGYTTEVTINISGGTIHGNIYGAGYGYSSYLTASQIATDGGTLYGDSYINITGGTINGNVYGAGRGYSGYSGRTALAQMYGTTHVTLEGTPEVNGNVYGAGEGISGYEDTAKLVGETIVNVNTDVSIDIYGAGNIAVTEGTTNVYIKSGTHSSSIYAGGNVGQVNGTSKMYIQDGQNAYAYGGGNQAQATSTEVYIQGGNTTNVFGGGRAADAPTTNVYIEGGYAENVFAGGNQSGTVQNSYTTTTGGTAVNVYGGNNAGGSVTTSNLNINGGTLTNVYGGGNRANVTTSNVNINNGNIDYVFGGGNSADTTNTNVIVTGGNANNVFGGGNQAGANTQEPKVTINGGNTGNVFGGGNQVETPKTDVTINSGTIANAYGGGNSAAVEQDTSIIMINGIITNNIYGGGNEGPVTGNSNLTINGGQIEGNAYGGGNSAGINQNSYITFTAGKVLNNIYGGGNEGPVTGNTYISITGGQIEGNAYAGGNGSTAVVYGNTNIKVQGENTIVGGGTYAEETSRAIAGGNVFGGGNAATTGTSATNSSTATVDITGGTIYGNVYGGANTSVVYGNTIVNIGHDTVTDSSMQISDIQIEGTVFGGGEANAQGSENYDFSFISVTKGIEININGNGYTHFNILGSIFGSGNASSASGESYINIYNYGTADLPKSNISLQRANCATLVNSALSLSGATDRTNEYSSTYFSLSRIDRVKLINNSILYMCNGANLLRNLDSILEVDGVEQKATAVIDPETGVTTRNVDNRIYMLEGKNLNVATNEQVTAYGQVSGMMFLGLFTNKNNPATSTGFYHVGYNNGDTIGNLGTFSSNSYVMAQHMTNHDITVDGFYSNINEDGIIKSQYIETTPEDDVYYIWLVGERMDVTVFELSLTASKYATLGTAELLLQGFSDPNIKLLISGFSAGLISEASLIDPSEIIPVNPDEEQANLIYGLTMRTGNTGWQTNGDTTFLTEGGGSYTGTTEYDTNNSTYTPTLTFCLYHSQNITQAQNLGDLRIRFQVLTPVDDLNYSLSYIDINIAISSALYQNDFYEAGITPGQEFGLFRTTQTTITSKSTFSTYYSLIIDNFTESKYYDDYMNNKRALVSTDANSMPYSYPANTKITMLDMVTKQYYYYIVTPEDVASGKNVYVLADFILMGSNNTKYNEQQSAAIYYDTTVDTVYENFIFHVNFADANLTQDLESYSILLELRNDEQQTLIGVLGIQRDPMKYDVYTNKDATIKLEGTLSTDTLYIGKTVNLDVTTNFTESVIDSKMVYDTQYFDQQLGIKLSFYDSNGNRLNIDSLLGVNFELDGALYYPRVDGTTRINIAEKVTDVLARLRIHTENNDIIPTGNYIIRIESFGSSDGIYYGLEASDTLDLDLRIINLAYGLKVVLGDEIRIIDKTTGFTQNGNNLLMSELQYESVFANPQVTISLYRRDYGDIYSQVYNLVDLQDYVQDTLQASVYTKEYVTTNTLDSGIRSTYLLKENLMSGTYKIVYKLYDASTYIGEAYDYIVIK